MLTGNGGLLGREAGVISDERWSAFNETRTTMADVMGRLRSLVLSPQVTKFFFFYNSVNCCLFHVFCQGWAAHGVRVQRDGIMRRSVI